MHTYECGVCSVLMSVHVSTCVTVLVMGASPKRKARCPEGWATLSQRRGRGHPSLRKSSAGCTGGAEKSISSFLPPFLPFLA